MLLCYRGFSLSVPRAFAGMPGLGVEAGVGRVEQPNRKTVN